MKLMKYNSLRPFASSNLNQFLDEFAGMNLTDFFDSSFFSGSPSINVIENDDAFQIEVAAPGLKKEDFRVEVDNGHLTISADRKSVDETGEEGRFTRREFNYSSFRRSFHLDEKVNAEGISASYNDGILTIALPKVEASENGKTTIEIS